MALLLDGMSGVFVAKVASKEAGIKLVVVESPAKASTINKYLGDGYKVLASYGHIRDLPAKNGSVDPENSFNMLWDISPRAKSKVDDLAKAAKGAGALILATDPDREGEAISWHVYQVLKDKKLIGENTPVERVVFNEITKKAVTEAMAKPRAINTALVEAYMARRALDYLVGFTLSPVLWRKLPGSRSAGRVQSVALRLICEREAEIEAFNPQEYWDLDVLLNTQARPPQAIESYLLELNGQKLDKLSLANEMMAKTAEAAVKNSPTFTVASVDKKTVRRNPQPPFITSTLQQDAARKLGFSVTRTMQTAQKLYEGVSLGGETVGLITYMRTDGTNLAEEAVAAIRGYIGSRFGPAYVPSEPRHYKTKSKNAQEAHEAIRPTDVNRTPEQVSAYVNEDQLRLYTLIWQRALACQMENAVLDQVSVDVETQGRTAVLRATGSTITFDGFYRVYGEQKNATHPEEKEADQAEAQEKKEDKDRRLPVLEVGQALDLKHVSPEQHFTKPPPRFGEAALVKRMEELGIGRPSTYASIIRVLQERHYVRLEARRFVPEDRGRLVTEFLSRYFAKYVEYDFTADLEGKLDAVSDGRLAYKQVLGEFWQPFHQAVGATQTLSIGEVLETLDEALSTHFFPQTVDGSDARACPSCKDGRLGLKLGRFGAFIGCSHYPECKYTRQITLGNDDETASNPEAAALLADGPMELGLDPVSGKPISLHRGPYGIYVQLGEPEPLPEPEKPIKKKTTKATTEKKEKKPAKPKMSKPKRSSLPAGLTADKVTLEEALKWLSLPRDLGLYPENSEPMSAALGRFGPYVKIGDTFVSLKPGDDVLTITAERAIELLETSGKKKIALGTYAGQAVNAQKGRFGYFLNVNGHLVALPKGMVTGNDPSTLTLEAVLPLLEKKLSAAEAAKKPAKAGGKTGGKSRGNSRAKSPRKSG